MSEDLKKTNTHSSNYIKKITFEFWIIIIFLISMYFDMSDSGVYYHRIIILFALLFIYIIKYPKIKFERNIYIYVFFLLLICASGLYGTNNSTALGNIAVIMSCLVLMIMIYNIITTEKHLLIYMNISIILSIILSIRVIFETDYQRLFIGTYYPDVVLQNAIGNRNVIAIMICLGFNFALYNIYNYKKRKYIISCIIMFIAILLTGSRKGLMLCILPFILIFFIKFVEHKNIISKIKILIISILLLFVTVNMIMNVEFIYNIIGFRVEAVYREIMYGEKSSEGSFNTRQKMIDKGLEYFEKKPLFGHGVSNYRYLYKKDTGKETYSHNNYIELLVNNGIIGFLLYYLFYLSVILSANKKRINGSSIRERNYYLFIISMLIAMLIMDTGVVSYNSYIIYMLLGLAMKKECK